jgi:hypothetical protein
MTLVYSNMTFIPTAYYNPPDGTCFQPMKFHHHMNFKCGYLFLHRHWTTHQLVELVAKKGGNVTDITLKHMIKP